MAKIDFPDGASQVFTFAGIGGLKAQAKKAKDPRENQKVRFSGLLERITQNTASRLGTIETAPVTEETIKALLDEIHSAGDDLKNRPLPEEIQRYKKAVRNFLHHVVKYGYTTEKQVSGANLLKRKHFTLVQVVDTKLEQLAAGILAGQTAQLELLRRLEEITGMLIDLLQ